jgi:signal transduction histidine kinase
MRSSVWYRLAMLGAMVVVVLNTWYAVRALNTLFVAQGARAHTLEVITHTKEIGFQVSSGNGAVRAYLLTGDPVFVARYHDAKAAIDAELDKLRNLTADSPSQQQRIEYLRQRIIVKRAALDAGVAMRSGAAGPMEPSVLGPVLADSPDGGPSVIYSILQIEQEEARLLAQRTLIVKAEQRQVWWSFFGVTCLDILLLAAAAELLIRVLRDRQMLSARTAEIAVLNADLEERVAQRTRELAVSNQELEAFSYSVSHDLRAPLRTIDGFSLALLEDFADKLNDEGRDYIGRVRAGVQRMGQLIDALLQLSRVTRTELSTEEVDLSHLATLVFNELAANDPERQADPARKVTFTAQPTPPAQGDPRLLRIALENLIGNAFKFTSRTPQATITFASRSEPGRTVYFVQDNGAGFDMHYVDRLFTAFQRLHGDRDFKGSGIGLATVSRIIRRHHGSIGAEGAPGQGATFFFDLAGQGQHPPAPTPILHDETPTLP